MCCHGGGPWVSGPGQDHSDDRDAAWRRQTSARQSPCGVVDRLAPGRQAVGIGALAGIGPDITGDRAGRSGI